MKLHITPWTKTSATPSLLFSERNLVAPFDAHTCLYAFALNNITIRTRQVHAGIKAAENNATTCTAVCMVQGLQGRPLEPRAWEHVQTFFPLRSLSEACSSELFFLFPYTVLFNGQAESHASPRKHQQYVTLRIHVFSVPLALLRRHHLCMSQAGR